MVAKYPEDEFDSYEDEEEEFYDEDEEEDEERWEGEGGNILWNDQEEY